MTTTASAPAAPPLRKEAEVGIGIADAFILIFCRRCTYPPRRVSD